MDTVPHSSAKIDRLSSLPPELLFTIFDLAYNPEQQLLEPLSKTLRPYFRRNLYRQIRIDSESSWSNLLNTVKASADLGSLVQDLDVSILFTPTTPEIIENIVNPFPRLISVNCGSLHRISPSSSLPPLRSLFFRRFILSMTDLVHISRFSRLTQLEICFEESDLSHNSLTEFSLPSLHRLSLCAESADEGAAQRWSQHLPKLLAKTPNLTHLDLSDEYFPRFIKCLPHIATLIPQLLSLRLDTSNHDEFFDITCDRHLPLFTNLRHLDLTDNTVGNTLPSYLRQLPQLSSLRFGENIHVDGPSSQDILSLVSGTSRLVKLEKLVIDCLAGKMGKRWDTCEMEARIDEAEFDRLPGWIKPGFVERFEAGDIHQIMLAGQQNGIEISGSVVEAVAIWDACYLEIANRKVMKAFKSKSLVGLIEMKGWDHHRCPDLDFDKLDPNNLKLVKIDLPEENWFAFSLE